MNEHPDSFGDGGDGGERTQRVDYAALFTTKVAVAVCACAQSAGRIGDRLAEAGREPPRETADAERLKYLGVANDVAHAIEIFADLIEHLRDAHALAKEKAANAFPRKDEAA